MKNFFKILLGLLFAFSSIFTFCYAESGDTIKVLVSEKIPGAGCVPEMSSNTSNEGPVEPKLTGLYECTIQPGFSSIQSIIGQIIKWFTALAALAGVLFIVINGILLSMGGEGKDEIKKRIVKTLTGLILLLLSGVILSIIAPWVYK